MGMINKDENLDEGEFFTRWLYNRLHVHNKNVLGAEVGGTGSGKSYRDLRKVELYYQRYMNKPFPIENICFGTDTIIKRLASGKLCKGEILIFEEAGANLGNLDFQNKISKMFTYVLQSFRSMNIAIFFNLPYLSMLNKSARMLLHYSSESCGIDFNTNTNKCKLKFHQVNQETGKIYKKYPRGKVNGQIRTIKRFNYSLPSAELISAYEKAKMNYLLTLTSDYVQDLKDMEWDKHKKQVQKELTIIQQVVYKYTMEGRTVAEIAKITNRTERNVLATQAVITKKGYSLNIG
jgi:uncharacterized membrane protein